MNLIIYKVHKVSINIIRFMTVFVRTDLFIIMKYAIAWSLTPSS